MGKGLLLAVAVLLAFLFTSWPRELVALAAAGILLTSTKLHSREMLGLVDWQLLVLFAGLFVVNGAMTNSGLTQAGLALLTGHGVHLQRPAWLFGTTLVLSNLVSNVPAVMLLLPAATDAQAGPILALVSTLAGNFVIVGSIANMIVVESAARQGVRIDFRTHARAGVPITLITLAITAGWLAVRAHLR